MSVEVPFGPGAVTAEPRWRLRLAITPLDALGGPPPTAGLRVEVEPRPVARRPARGPRTEPEPGGTPLPRNRGGAYTLVDRADHPRTATELVVRLSDPGRRWVPRRLRVPLRPDDDLARGLAPVLYPGAGHPGPGTATGARGRLVRLGKPVRWARIVALGPGDQELGRAFGDERGEFLLPVARTGREPMPPASLLTVRLKVSAPASGSVPPPGDALADLPIEDAVLRDAGTPPGTADEAVLAGDRVPPGHVPAPDRPEIELTVGAVVVLPPLTLT